MKAFKIPLIKKLTLTLLSIYIVSFNLAMAQSDKQSMADVQKAREMVRMKDGHAQHVKPVDDSQKFRGVYYGYLPCKDCAGIKTTLSLKNKQNYLIVTQHAQASTREYYEKGKYTWDDKSRTVTLVSRKDESIKKYQIKNDATLIVLRSDGTPMKGNKEAYTLKRSDQNKMRELHIH